MLLYWSWGLEIKQQIMCETLQTGVSFVVKTISDASRKGQMNLAGQMTQEMFCEWRSTRHLVQNLTT